MKMRKTENAGSALILVVVVTVLLSVIGVIFVMTTRMRSLTTSNITDNRDLEEAVHSAVGQINAVLTQDLFGTNLTADMIDGTGNNETYDSLGADSWLASLEPSTRVNSFGRRINYWSQVTDLYGNNFGVPDVYYDPDRDNQPLEWDGTTYPELKVLATGVSTKIISEGERVYVIKQNATDWSKANVWNAGARADADGDGVADSRWMRVPNLFTSKGKPVYAAVRIIDNCALLNLNTAFGFYQNAADTNPWYMKSWYEATAYLPPINLPYCPNFGDQIGHYLSEINYGPFLRAYDIGHIERLRLGRDPIINPWKPAQTALTCQNYHDNVTMKIESPGVNYTLFDIGDELEMRNRFLLTSKGVSRFEKRHLDMENRDAFPPSSYSGILYYTFDLGRGIWGNDNGAGYPKARVPSVPFTASDFQSWKNKIDPQFFDFNPPPDSPPTDYEYDRRHVCTFYSFDRNLRYGKYPKLEPVIQNLRQTNPAQARAIEEVFRPLDFRPIDLRTIDITSNSITARRNILHLLYAFREQTYYSLLLSVGYELPGAMGKSAEEAVQRVANMIDFMDSDTTGQTGPFGTANYGSQVNANPTYINRAIIRQLILDISTNAGYPIDIDQPQFIAFDFGLTASDVVYGYERQPFISEVYCDYTPTGAQGFALELLNPYAAQIDLDRWNIRIGATNYPLAPANTYIVPGGTSTTPGRLVIYDGTVSGIAPGWQKITNFGLGVVLIGGVLELQRPDPDPANTGQFITVDGIDNTQRTFLITAPGPGNSINVSSRDDTAWKFTNKAAYVNGVPDTLGKANNIPAGTVTPKGYQLPVDNAVLRLDRFADFQRIPWVEPNELTDHIANAASESDVRFDMTVNSGLLGYICTLSRQEKGIPGRININTAPVYVIAAAIPPQLVITNYIPGDPNSSVNPLTLAQSIIDNRPYTALSDLLKKIPAIKKFADLNINMPDVGEQGIKSDLEERDWIFNRLANIFTVRSDTFTAYILVRLGTDGPQRRMIAIFDRSNVWTASDKPKLLALHPVPDPR